MVHPGAVVVRRACLHGKWLASHLDVARERELRLADVAAGVLWQRPFAGQALLALQQQGLGAGGGERQREILCLRADRVAAASGRSDGLALQQPVRQPDIGIGFAGLRNTKACARDALVMAQAFPGDIGESGVREQQLPGGEG